MSASRPPGPDGLLVIDKPPGFTSHDVVARVRRLAGTRKVGHAGTLDPMATGVLVLGLGRATRLLGHLALGDKTYTATIRLGLTTITDDAEGDVVEIADGEDVDRITRADVDRLQTAGIRAILVGETLMRAHDMATAVEELLGTSSKNRGTTDAHG